jgi:hypothetical protein
MFGCCLIGLAFGFNGISISPISPSNPFIFENFVGNKSLYACSNYGILSTV